MKSVYKKIYNYLSNANNFAQVMNEILYNGESTVRPGDLRNVGRTVEDSEENLSMCMKSDDEFTYNIIIEDSQSSRSQLDSVFVRKVYSIDYIIKDIEIVEVKTTDCIDVMKAWTQPIISILMQYDGRKLSEEEEIPVTIHLISREN